MSLSRETVRPWLPLRHLAGLVLRRWNWKAAATSAVIRGLLFSVVNLRAGRTAAFAALATELGLRLITSGFYGSITQAFSRLAQEGERKAPGRVHLHGHVGSRDALARIYANADVLLHPNPREPLGLAPLEAMASGLPLVAPASGGVVDYANGDNAWLTDPTPQAFAQAVSGVLGCARQTSVKVARALATAETHDWSHVTRRYFALYDHLHRQSAPIRHIGRT